MVLDDLIEEHSQHFIYTCTCMWGGGGAGGAGGLKVQHKSDKQWNISSNILLHVRVLYPLPSENSISAI